MSASPIRILHLEDTRGDALLVRSSLESEGLDCEIRNVTTRDEFVSALARETFDLVLSDYALPSFDGITALDMVRGRNPDLPFIFVSGAMGEELAIETLKAGATDYVLKDRLSRLAPSIQRALAESREQEKRRRDEKRTAMRFAVTQTLAESESLEEAVPRILEALGEGGDWVAGAFWKVDPEANLLRCAGFWRRRRAEVSGLEAATREATFGPDAVLPGRVWTRGEPLWISDVQEEPAFLRGEAARRDGIRAACGLPIRSGTRVIGALDLFAAQARAPDEVSTRILDDVGSQIGQFHERRLAERALRESEEKYRSIVETTNEWIWAIDVHGRITYSNRGVQAMIGYAPEELRGCACQEFVHPEDLPGFHDLLRRCGAQRSGWTGYVQRWRHKNGDYRHLESNATPVLDAGGALAGYRGAGRDITERIHVEAQRAQSQKLEAIGTLAGGIAHDFNNLLTSILGHCDLVLGQASVAQPVRRDIEEIRRAGGRAAALTRQLLAFSRKQVLAPVVLNLNAVVAELEKMLRRLIGEDIDLVSVLAPDLGRVKADPSQIEQVVMNLVVNSRDVLPRGGRVTIETRNVELGESSSRGQASVRPGRYVLLRVSDTGSGMDAVTASRVFEPFFTTKGAGKGTGLGLSTVYGIVKQSGGHIEVESEPDRGTAFQVYLPRVEEAEAHPIPPRPVRLVGGSETILLVEDENALRALARRVLEMNGYRVLEAASAESAQVVSRAHAGAIHLMVTDAVMPGASGPELARALSSARPDMKVLFMSGYADDTIVRHGLLASAQAFLQKPFSPELLTRKVREMLDSGPP